MFYIGWTGHGRGNPVMDAVMAGLVVGHGR